MSEIARNDEMYTPSFLIEAARDVMGSIDLDPASCEVANRTVKADRFYTKEQNGLDKTWAGNVWLNPPYSRGNMLPFSERFVFDPVRNGTMICNAMTSTRWFQLLCRKCECMCILSKRISFIDSKTMEPKKGNDRSQVVFFRGVEWMRFKAVFAKYGHTVLL